MSRRFSEDRKIDHFNLYLKIELINKTTFSVALTFTLTQSDTLMKNIPHLASIYMQWQEPMSRSMQLHYIPVTAFS